MTDHCVVEFEEGGVMREPDSRYSWCVAAATLVLSSLSFGAVNSMPMLFPEVAAEFGWDGGKVASLFAVAMAGAGISSLFFGRLLDRIGFFKIGLIATLSSCAGVALASFATELWHFYFVYGVLIGGLGQGAFLSTSAAAVSQWFKRSRSLAVAIALSGQGVGGLLVPPTLRAITGAEGWREALLVYSVFCLVMMVAAAIFYLPKPPEDIFHPPSKTVSNGIRNDAESSSSLIIWLALALLLANSASVGVSSHLVSYGAYVGLSPVLAGSLMSAHYGLVLVSRLIVGYCLDRLDKNAVLVTMTVIQIAGTLLILSTDSILMVVVGASAIGVGFGGYYPAYGAIVQACYPREKVGRRMTELYLASFIAAGFGTWLVGVLFDIRGGFDLAFFVTFLLSVLSLIVVLSCRQRIVQGFCASGM